MHLAFRGEQDVHPDDSVWSESLVLAPSLEQVEALPHGNLPETSQQ